MANDTRLDHWLDLWEELEARQQPVSLEEFIRQNCQDAPADLVEDFRSKVRALRSVDADLRAAGTTGRSTAATGEGAEDAEAPKAAALDLKPDSEPIPGYRLVSRLGQGGFGQVWKATAPRRDAGRAEVRRPRRPCGAGRAACPRPDEAAPTSHLLCVFGSWQADGALVIAMELADRTLMDRFQEARAQGLPGIPRDELLAYLADAAQALDFLNQPQHRIGERGERAIQHRDTKPHNLLLCGGGVKVGDFGLARCLEHSLTSHTGSLTVPYAAPEFFDGKTSSQSDQYSLAVTYCHLRGGRLPFEGSQAQIVAGHLRGQPDLSMLLPEEQPAVARALSKKPRDRWPTCGAFVEALRQAKPDAARLRAELLGDPENPVLRRSYLALRTPELRELDRQGARLSRRQRWEYGTRAVTTPAFALALTLAACFRPE